MRRALRTKIRDGSWVMGTGRRTVSLPLLVLLAMLPICSPAHGQEMVSIPAGTFTMGRNDGPADERPAHPLEVPAFEIDRFPVTNERFAGFLNAIGPLNAKGERLFDVDDPDARIHRMAGKWRADAGHEAHPVVEVTWVGARDYCAWRGKRLPTEAEW